MTTRITIMHVVNPQRNRSVGLNGICSGFQVEFNLSLGAGHCVRSLAVLCMRCRVLRYEAVRQDKVYSSGARDYLGNTKKHYRAELESVDFKAGSEAARLHINAWVQEQTQDTIKDLLAEGVVDSLTRLVLVNAIYFKGNWNKQFQESATRDTQFRLNKNETKSVKMMHQKSKFPLAYIPEASCQVLEIPYKGKELSMLIFLPKTIEDSTTGLEKIEKELTYENFVEWTRADMMDVVELQVGLPRFKMEENYDMKNVLCQLAGQRL
ncbi:Leukocyte elastase inhibitor [Liparis tanakae]|uniref:Leukocyte elastase inhibitor n=1 Tax=Liparis tanakae TaxID=230148 RepID=A0A4Z2IKH8_9TELE|nr:Leukocyte elastase inhibitor [Liparis tanakae]